VSEELVLLREYASSLGLIGKELDDEDWAMLRAELNDAGEFGLYGWVRGLKSAKELEEYLGEEE